jgi:hypothetical protein
MSDTKTSAAEPAVSPPYIPWKTFSAYAGSLKSSTIPHTLDSSVRPSSMAGSLWRQLASALQFLGLIDPHKVVKDAMGKLVKSHGTGEWAAAVKSYVLPAYAGIVDGLPLDRATSQQLEKCFRERGHVDGQMLDKVIRFYLHSLREAGVKYSDHLAIRKDRGTKKPRAPKQKSSDPPTRESANGRDQDGRTKKKKSTVESPDEDIAPPGTKRFPLYFKDKADGMILVPDELDNDDLKVIELTVSVIKAYAGQKAGKRSG